MNLRSILKKNATKFSNSPALTMKIGFRTISLSYKDVYKNARKIALLLEKNGLSKGDKVLILAPNSPHWICVFWGCLISGIVAVPLNVQSTDEMIEKIADQVGAKIFFTYRMFKGKTPTNAARYDIDSLDQHLAPFDPKNFNEPKLSSDDTVEILYTSGTTGEPKGVMLTHKNLCSTIEALRQMVPLKTRGERLISILPLSHIFEQVIGFLLPFAHGVQIIYAHSPAAIGQLMKKYRVTKIIAVPEFLRIFMSKIEAGIRKSRENKLVDFLFSNSLFSKAMLWFVRKKFGGVLDTVVCAGAPLDPELEKKWNNLGLNILQGYGLTETAPLVSANTYKEHRFQSVGKVAPGVKLRISGDGEIQVKGANVFSGYFKNEALTKDSFTEDGYFKTGDIGELDRDGFLFLRGRKKYMILGPGGQNVFPEDIEAVLNSIEGVKDSAVIGLPKESGVEIHAVILLENGVSDKEKIVDTANKKLVSYQQIASSSVWPEIDFPRSVTKKIRKEKVVELVTSQEKQAEPVGEINRFFSLVSQVTGVSASRIGRTTTLQELSVDSLMRIELIVRVEEHYSATLDETKLTAKISVGEIEEMIAQAKEAKAPDFRLSPLKRWPRSWPVRLIRFFIQPLVLLILKIFVKLRVEGRENLSNIKGPVIFMPNHISYFDAPILVAALNIGRRQRLAFAAARDVLYGEYKWFSTTAELLLNTFPFPRKENENIALGLDHMGTLLDQGYSVGVFPEGRVSETGKLLELKKGAGLVAVQMRVSIVPVVIKGSEKIFPYSKYLPVKRGLVTVRFGKPITFNTSDSFKDATKRIREALTLLF